jgi:hypothetical protein
MPRSKLAVLSPPAAPPQTTTPLAPRVIHADALHTLGEWQAILALPQHTLRREARLGRLRTSKRAGRLWALGSWVREWIEGGEVRRTARSEGGATTV